MNNTHRTFVFGFMNFEFELVQGLYAPFLKLAYGEKKTIVYTIEEAILETKIFCRASFPINKDNSAPDGPLDISYKNFENELKMLTLPWEINPKIEGAITRQKELCTFAMSVPNYANFLESSTFVQA